jgi:hypothetical protein
VGEVGRGKTVTEAGRVKGGGAGGGAASPVSRGLPQKEPGREGWGGGPLLDGDGWSKPHRRGGTEGDGPRLAACRVPGNSPRQKHAARVALRWGGVGVVRPGWVDGLAPRVSLAHPCLISLFLLFFYRCATATHPALAHRFFPHFWGRGVSCSLCKKEGVVLEFQTSYLIIRFI